MGWTYWHREAERDREMLKGILAFLISFAVMAERASGLPCPVRLRLLGCLREAEASAWAFAFAEAHGCGVALPREACAALSASLPVHADEEAGRLARSFRALAAMLALTWRFAGSAAETSRTGRAPAGDGPLEREGAGAAPAAPDTS